jgi:hypothetical protein
MKLAWRSKPCNPTTKESFCPRSLMTFCMNVESNNKQVFFTHRNVMESWNEPMGPCGMY